MSLQLCKFNAQRGCIILMLVGTCFCLIAFAAKIGIREIAGEDASPQSVCNFTVPETCSLARLSINLAKEVGGARSEYS